MREEIFHPTNFNKLQAHVNAGSNLRVDIRSERLLHLHMNNSDLLASAPVGGTVLDVGCFDFTQMKQAAALNRSDLRHSGVDYCPPAAIPKGFDFRLADLDHDPIPFADDQFDVVLAIHIVEHLAQPVTFFGECLRVCKPGGRIFVSCPSERSLLLPGFPFDWDKFHSTSFFDDPTHLGRPFSPQSLWRLARYYGCQPVEACYEKSWKWRVLLPLLVPTALILRKAWILEYAIMGAVGWSSHIVVEKPKQLTGKPPFNYYIPSQRADDWLGRLVKKIFLARQAKKTSQPR